MTSKEFEAGKLALCAVALEAEQRWKAAKQEMREGWAAVAEFEAKYQPEQTRRNKELLAQLLNPKGIESSEAFGNQPAPKKKINWFKRLFRK